MTFLQILNIIKDTALAQPNVNTVVREFLDLNREDTKYSAVVIQDRDGLRDRIVEQDWNTYTFHLGYVDRLTYDESNRDDIFSTGINVINNIVASIRDRWDLDVSIIDRFSTFNQRFTASCAGVYVVLAIQVPVSDCVDGEETDLYDKFEIKITENGDYHFVPDGRPVDEIDITIDVSGGGEKPEESLVETISSNGDYHYDPSAGSVFSDVSIAVDVHPTTSLSETYTTNGTKTITGEFNGGTVNVNVHPSVSLSEIYVSNGVYSISGEFNGGSVEVSVPSDQKPETICDKIIEENGSFHYYPESGEVFNDVHITTNVHPSESLVRSITDNSSYHYDGEWSGADITVNVHPSVSLSETYISNGSYSISGEFNGGVITVSVPSPQFVTETLNASANGTYTPGTGVNGFSEVNVDVHPSVSLSETYISNGSYSISGEFNGGVVTVSVPSPQFVTETFNIYENGTFYPSPGVDGFSEVNVLVEPNLQYNMIVSSNGTYYPDEGYDGIREVNVEVPGPVMTVISISSNGTYYPDEGYDGYEYVEVNVPSPQFVTETLSVSANGTYTPSVGVNGFSQVTVDIHPSVSLSETYTSNGSYSISGEFNGGVVTVAVSTTETVTMTQAQYDSLTVKDPNTIYLING